jgi:DNA topoisomerase-1
MAKSLIIVESPAKARTIQKYLGKEFAVKASIGHVRDLPEKDLGIDVESDFQPKYVVIRGKGKILTELRQAAKAADRVYLATDPDREGEAIAWHVAQEIKAPKEKVYRVLFNEITPKAIREAMARPGKIDPHKVDAQQARRVQDRLMGYQLSPLLWKKVRRGLSAGRVQSITVRLVCEREAEIRAFRPEEYWSITALLEGAQPPPFEARLFKWRGEKVRIAAGDEARRIVEALSASGGARYAVARIETKEKRRNPVPPFITSTLQQEAARKLGFTAKKTMTLAQMLYEGVELGKEGPVGLITYMRTDSTRVADEAVQEARAFIRDQYGPEYLPEQPPRYASGKSAQEAHEAIRPTAVARSPEAVKPHLERDLFRLYQIIWSRFMASQMRPALIDATTVEIAASASGGEAIFRATGNVIKFPGFMRAYTEGKDETPAAPEAEPSEEEERRLPPLREGESLTLQRLTPKQHFTQPPPRYSEASLVKALEEQGIGRPSTYAAILSTIQERKYAQKVEKALHPTDLGCLVNDLLVTHFPSVVNVEFTARMEEELDKIEEGALPWVTAVRDFYQPFHESLEKARVEMRNVKAEVIPTEHVCEKCGRPMVIRWGRNGSFLACSGYPECKNTKEYVKDAEGAVRILEAKTTEEACPACGRPMVIKNGRFGRFLACSGYPECKQVKPFTIGIACPEPGCGGQITEKRSKRGKIFYSCTRYPECKFASWDRPLPQPCPQCGSPYLVEKVSARTGPQIRCPKKECGYQAAG